MGPNFRSIRLVLLPIFSMLLSAQAGAQGADPDPAQVLRLRQEAIAYENGEGVPRDPVLAADLYCKAARRGDAVSQYNLGWMYANGRGLGRNDQVAAFFFNAAAQQGLAVARRMLAVVGGPTGEMPDCMRDPAPLRIEPVQAEQRPDIPSKPPLAYQVIAPRPVYNLVMKMAPKFKVDPQLALAIIEAESNFNSLAISPKNARGLMQLIPETARRFNVRNPYDPAQNLRGGLTYLRWLLAYFEGDVALVAAAYNAGEGRVEQFRGIPPYPETRDYVQRILDAVGRAVYPFDQAVTPPSPALASMRVGWGDR